MTQIFIDTADIEDIKKYLFFPGAGEWNIGLGVTTNQKIFLKTARGKNFEEHTKEILKVCEVFPVSIEGPNDYKSLIEFAIECSNWGKNVVVKVPMLGNGDGLRVASALKTMGIKTNVTACMNINQVFLAQNAGATYVSLFYNRIKDLIGTEGALLTVSNSMDILRSTSTKLIVGSIRSPGDIMDLLDVKPHIITIPPKILEKMPYHAKTEETLKEFEEAWQEFQRS